MIWEERHPDDRRDLMYDVRMYDVRMYDVERHPDDRRDLMLEVDCCPDISGVVSYVTRHCDPDVSGEAI